MISPLGGNSGAARIRRLCQQTRRAFLAVAVAMPYPLHGEWQAILVPAARHEIEIVVRTYEQIQPTPIGRIGVVHAIPIAQEDTRARLFALHVVGLAQLLEGA